MDVGSQNSCVQFALLSPPIPEDGLLRACSAPSHSIISGYLAALQVWGSVLSGKLFLALTFNVSCDNLFPVTDHIVGPASY